MPSVNHAIASVTLEKTDKFKFQFSRFLLFCQNFIRASFLAKR